MKLAIVAGVLWLTAAATVRAQEAPGLISITKVNSAEELAALTPPRAVAEKVTGEVGLKCVITAAGKFADCVVTSESPVGYGFGDAAIKAASNERVKPVDDLGRSLECRVIDRGFTFLAPGDADPRWKRRATPEEIAAVYPAEAKRQGVEGRVIMSCNVTTRGVVVDCKITSETPIGPGFGAAALKLASKFRLTPKIRGGKAVPTTINIPISW